MSRPPIPLTINPIRAAAPYTAYSYSYPHKTAYRPITPGKQLREVWAGEARDALFFYAHLPFCEMRCGFCNLFTTANPADDVVDGYLNVLEREIAAVKDALGAMNFARAAIGGGTPTYLSARQLERLFDMISGMLPSHKPTNEAPDALRGRAETIPHFAGSAPRTIFHNTEKMVRSADPSNSEVIHAQHLHSMGALPVAPHGPDVHAARMHRPDAHATFIPMSVETSPRTAESDRLAVLKSHGVSRISIGVQSMIDAEVNAAGRAQKESWVSTAIERIRGQGFATLNVDLMYGLPGQTVASWRESVSRVLRFKPEELYLYPLYVRPLTGLDRRGTHADDQLRLECYRAARDMLLAGGYEQLSMRMFRAACAPEQSGPVYCCQDDGMVGLGCGARSYTRRLHYSSEYAVGASGVKAILRGYLQKSDADLGQVHYGCVLDPGEQKRRYVIKSLLRSEGLDPSAYAARFGSRAIDDMPEFLHLIEEGFVNDDGRLRLTEAGMERSDSIGPHLYSDSVREMMNACELQ